MDLSRKGKLRILFINSSSELLDQGSSNLRFSFEVVGVGSTQEAASRLEENTDTFDAVLIDQRIHRPLNDEAGKGTNNGVNLLEKYNAQLPVIIWERDVTLEGIIKVIRETEVTDGGTPIEAIAAAPS